MRGKEVNTLFGERLKEAREAAGYTQKELGKLLHLDESTISNYEADKRQPKPEIIERIASILHVSPNFLFGWEESWFDNINPKIKRFIMENDSGPWLELARELKRKDIPSESVKLMIDALAVAVYKIKQGHSDLQAIFDKKE
jgi:transcriptional regulator with XRE-family HTH domain